VSIQDPLSVGSDTSSEGKEERKTPKLSQRENISRAISDNMLNEPRLLENMNLRELASMQTQRLAWNELPISQKFKLFKLPYLLGGIGAICQCFSVLFTFVPNKVDLFTSEVFAGFSAFLLWISLAGFTSGTVYNIGWVTFEQALPTLARV